MKKPLVVGIGELLWDLFPDEKRPGGAPANVVYNATQLGAEGCLVSRVGNDANGNEIVSYLQGKGVNTEYIQVDSRAPTGTVEVSFDIHGEPQYNIVKSVAWDNIEFNEALAELSEKCDAVVFGTLARRTEQSADAIKSFLQHTSRDTLKVLDLNFRPDGYNREIVDDSLRLADVIKINRDELEELKLLLETVDPVSVMLEQYEVRGVCLTLGSEGSSWFEPGYECHQQAYLSGNHQGDSVGLGDGFTAVLTLELLQQYSPEEALEKASRYTSLLAGKQGGMPELENDELSLFAIPSG
jgi:fructokinase